LKSEIKSNIFHWFYLFPYCSLLWLSDILPKSLIYTTHIKKVIAKLYSFTLRSKITDKKQDVRNFAWHRPTETYLTERFVTALKAKPQVYRRFL